MDRNATTITGTVQAVVFQNAENGWTVLKLRMQGGTVTCVGFLPGVNVGEGLTLTGAWVNHPSFGQQFQAETCQRSLPTGTDSIYQYLASGVIKGVGARTAQLLVAHFGSATLTIIEEEPERLTEIKGITDKKAREIGRQFQRQAGLRRLMDFLMGYGVKPFAAARLFRIYGEGAKQAVVENPYILADDYFGLDFFEADNLAVQLGFAGDSPERVEAAVLFEMRHNTQNGHVFLPRAKLKAASAQLIGVPEELVETAIEDLTDGDYIIRETVAGVDACYLDDLYREETFTAERLLALTEQKVAPDRTLERDIAAAEAACTVTFAAVQREALRQAADRAVLVLTGGPGTGKTTTVRGILELYNRLGLKTLLTAPTGRAAKRLTELTGREAQTVHRLLGAGMPEETEQNQRLFNKNASEPLDCGAVILDEASMMDITLMSALLEAMPPRARLILVGDADQLPSVGPGNVFGDIIRSQAVPVVRLNEIFRQAEASDIVKNAHRINKGELPALKNKGGDFFFLQRRGGEGTAETVASLVAERLPQRMGIPAEEIQVLSPSRKTRAGTGELNLLLQQRLNPPRPDKREKPVGGSVLRVGDRVIQTRNNYDLTWYRYEPGEETPAETGEGIYNGDVGYIEDIDERREFVKVRFEDRLTAYPFELLGDLELAYAMTVHKSQGSEYRAVVLAIPEGVPLLKTRSVLYTAVTRARELLILVGDGADIQEMVENNKRQRRYSGLRARLAREGQEGTKL